MILAMKKKTGFEKKSIIQTERPVQSFIDRETHPDHIIVIICVISFASLSLF